ncbi:MAG: tol-pal system-associated acyl-CoA thioesterase [Anderseniella sp.]|jgi:acyl-CoA thioester hydrolase|nr:tol-pal system-associated acyl-CoA thioesterase [Anderseniella sp.]
MTLSGTLKDGVHRLDIRIYYEDTDFSGLVYHANYLKFCERGRSDMLRLAGIVHTGLAEQGLGFVVRRMTCDFRAPARIDDVICVETRLKDARPARFVLEQQVLLQDKVLFAAEVMVALIDANGRPQRMPASLMQKISES